MADLCRVVHEIPPVYDARSRVLILGTIPSPKSREYGFFYGHPRNRFWKVLAALFQSPVPQTNEQKRGFLLDRRIALWDVLAACEIEGASDASIKNATPNDLSPILQTARIRAICTTGTKAAALYRRYSQPATGLPAVALPSTSPANCACSFESLCASYQMILNFLED